jgi:hypothetical protein
MHTPPQRRYPSDEDVLTLFSALELQKRHEGLIHASISKGKTSKAGFVPGDDDIHIRKTEVRGWVCRPVDAWQEFRGDQVAFQLIAGGTLACLCVSLAHQQLRCRVAHTLPKRYGHAADKAEEQKRRGSVILSTYKVRCGGVCSLGLLGHCHLQRSRSYKVPYSTSTGAYRPAQTDRIVRLAKSMVCPKRPYTRADFRKMEAAGETVRDGGWQACMCVYQDGAT